MPVRLIALGRTADIVLTGLLTIVGRHESCETRVVSSRVSRRHCCLALADGAVLVRDLGSRNGTWINGNRIEEGVLRPGDILGIAHLRFRLDLPVATRSEGMHPQPASEPCSSPPKEEDQTALNDGPR